MVLQAAKTNGAAIRRATVPVEVSGEGPWTLHYFFEWVRRGVTQGSPAYFEQIVARPITYQEHNPDYNCATLVYNIGDDGWTHAVPMSVEGAPEMPVAAPEWPEEEGRAIAQRKRRQQIDGLPLPHVFHAKVFGTVGARVFYSIHVWREQGVNPFADSGTWIPRREIIL
jgi:hypothetical protein